MYFESLSSQSGRIGKSCCYWGLHCLTSPCKVNCSEGIVENEKVVSEVWQSADIQYSVGNRVPWVWVLWVSVKRIFQRDSLIWNWKKNVKCKLRKWQVRMSWMANSYGCADMQIGWKVGFVTRDVINQLHLFSLFCCLSWNKSDFSLFVFCE